MQEEDRELSPLEFGAIVAVILGALIAMSMLMWVTVWAVNEPCILSECNDE